ncbi:MAG: hypothetical protein ABSA02_06985 [Trebonia sp.]|jgi:hypothetical protein
MGMIRLLIALYPKQWRGEFGEEFAALLEDTRLTPGAVADVVAGAGKLHAERHRQLAFVIASLVWSGCLEFLSVRAGLTANILWAPTTPARALALVATIAPWAALAAVALAHRLRSANGSGDTAKPGVTAGGSTS